MKVLFVCRANAGRSQMAEAFFNSKTKSNSATSVGVDLAHSILKDDLSVPPLVIEVMQEAGIDISSARRKALTEPMADAADLIIAIMGEDEFPLPKYVTESPKFTRWDDIPDAKGTDLRFHRTVRDQIREKVNGLSH